MPLVRVGPEVYSKLKALYVVLEKLGRVESLGDVIKYLIESSPLNELLSVRSPKELAILYAQLASKSWNELNAELAKACGSGLDGMDKESGEYIYDYLRSRLGLDEAEALIKTKP